MRLKELIGDQSKRIFLDFLFLHAAREVVEKYLARMLDVIG